MAGYQPWVRPRRTLRSLRLWLAVLAVLIATSATLSGASAQLQRAAAESADASDAPAQSALSELTRDVADHSVAPAPSSPSRHTPPRMPVIIAPVLVGPVRTSPVIDALASDGIPSVALDAYRRAARGQSVACGIPWPLLAGIGRVESDHGRFAGAQLRSDGSSTRRVIGIALDGAGTALIRDSDRGRLDGDLTFDRAVGPMQFIPSTWAAYGVDGNRDHIVDPFNIYDAAASAARYLCAAGGDLRTSAGQIRAVRAYNDSDSYLASVFGLERAYAAGVPGVTIPIFGVVPALGPPAPLPPVDPGPPAALRRTTRPVHRPAQPPRSTPSRTVPPTSTPPVAATSTAQPTTTTAPPTTPSPTCTPAPSSSAATSSSSLTPSPTDTPTPTSTPSASASSTSTAVPTVPVPTVCPTH